jgi:hypothetical protein
VICVYTQPALAQQSKKVPKGYVKIGETDTEIIYQLIGDKPSIDPGDFVTEHERQFVKAQISALKVKKKSFEDQLRGIERIRAEQTLYAKDMDQLRQQLILDNAVHAFNVIEAGLSALAANGKLTAEQEAQIKRLLTTTKGATQALSAETAGQDQTRQLNKAADAAFTLKNLADVSEKIMSAEQSKAFRNAIDTLPKLLRISEQMAKSRPAEDTLKMYIESLDDALDAAGNFFYPLKAARSTAHILDGEVAMWMIRQDRGAIEDAFVRSSTAKRYYLNRIAEVDERLAFYEERQRRSK